MRNPQSFPISEEDVVEYKVVFIHKRTIPCIKYLIDLEAKADKSENHIDVGSSSY